MQKPGRQQKIERFDNLREEINERDLQDQDKTNLLDQKPGLQDVLPEVFSRK
jgi:hypothetical protein